MKPMTVVRIAVAAVGLGIAGWLAHNAYEGRQEVDQYNRIIKEYYNEQKYAQAAEKLSDLAERVDDPDLRREIRGDILQCYLYLGDDPGHSARESARWYRKAWQLDPDALDESQKRAMELAERPDSAQ